MPGARNRVAMRRRCGRSPVNAMQEPVEVATDATVPQDAPAARPAALHEPYRAKKQAEDGGDDRVAPAGFRGRAGP
jgi:hypothetical protein